MNENNSKLRVRTSKLLVSVIAAVVLVIGASIAGVALAAAGPKPSAKPLGAEWSSSHGAR